MKERAYYYIAALVVLVIMIKILPSSNMDPAAFEKRAKISLREVGNQLLLTNKDSTSRVLPIKRQGDFQFELSFESNLSIEPDTLVSIVKKSLQPEFFPQNYRVEVMQCSDGEVAYSYEINEDKENTIIPCIGRTLPAFCYTIEVEFLHETASFPNKWISIIAVFISFIFVWIIRRKQKAKTKNAKNKEEYTSIGSFRFYPDQNKLIKEAEEISLSKKECELLEIFVANPNQVLKREDLTKRVWEDNGVFVGRSLDTYISKLRKKLQDDSSVKITNVHGVGYKLEVTSSS